MGSTNREEQYRQSLPGGGRSRKGGGNSGQHYDRRRTTRGGGKRLGRQRENLAETIKRQAQIKV